MKKKIEKLQGNIKIDGSRDYQEQINDMFIYKLDQLIDAHNTIVGEDFRKPLDMTAQQAKYLDVSVPVKQPEMCKKCGNEIKEKWYN